MKRIWALLALLLLVGGLIPAVSAQGPVPAMEEQAQAPVAELGVDPAAPGGITSLSGSVVTFDPAGGGDMCWAAGSSQTFCFLAESYTNDWEYVYNMWERFPTDWVVNDVYDAGPTYCDSGSWGAFSWSYHAGNLYEINVTHARYQSPTDYCYTYYCFDVTTGAGGGFAYESWYWDGDGYGGTPHWPCSDDGYTPSGQNACDESVEPQAAIPSCQPGLYLLPETLEVQGCAGDPQIHTFNLWNNTGSDGTFNLAYTVPSGNGTLTGPGSLTIPNGVSEPFDVTLTPNACLPDGTEVIGVIDADGNGYSDQSVITKTIGAAGGWDTVPGSAPGWAGGGYPSDGCGAMNDAGEWVTYVIGDQAGFAGFWGYNHDTNTWFQPGAANTPSDRWPPDWAYDAETNLCYMTGGATTPGTGNINEAWEYDPVANAFTQLPNFTTVRDFHDSWVGNVGGTKYLCVGGGNSGGVGLTSTQCYDIAGGAWDAENATIPAYPTDIWAAADGTLYAPGGDQFWVVSGVQGGGISDQARYYDDADGTWHTAGNTGQARYRVEGDFKHGNFYQMGGATGSFVHTPTAVRGENVGGTWIWTQIDDMPNSRMDNVAVMLPPFTLARWKPIEMPETAYDASAVADLASNEGGAPALPAAAPVEWNAPQVVLWDNGPLVTHPGACSGHDASRLQTGLGMNTLGFGHQVAYGYRMADDFDVTDPAGWQIDQIIFFAYQTNMPPDPSPITGVYYQIWDGPPDDPASNIVFGDLVTNRLDDSVWANMQRDSETSPCANNRYIFADTASAGVLLPPGTYWLDWMTDGSGASGPWAPPITIIGQTTTGNALQYTTSWGPANDSGTGTQQGMPFIIEGTIPGAQVGTIWSVDGYGSTSADYVDYLVQCPPCEAMGWLDGHVYDMDNGMAVPCTDAEVHIEPVGWDIPVDPADGSYWVQLPEGQFDVSATAPGYSIDGPYTITITDQMTTTQDFGLYRPVIGVEPDNFVSVTIPIGGPMTYTLIISNNGGLPLDFEIFEVPPAMGAGEHKLTPRAVGIDPTIVEEMAASPDGTTGFFVAFWDTADLSGAYQLSAKADKIQFVRQALQAAADSAQANVRAWLDARGIAYQSFLASNSIYLEADYAVLEALAAFPEVSGFGPNRINEIMPVESTLTLVPDYAPPAWDIQSWADAYGINAVGVWDDFGITGQGVIVANVDTGVKWDHPALQPNYACGGPPHDNCFRDPANDCGGTACDNNGHGTGTMGQMAADNDDGFAMSVGGAPDAQWVACVGCPGGSCPDWVIADCVDWMINTTPYTPDLVNNSWGIWSPICDYGHQAENQAYLAAGIMPIYAAGNIGNACSTSTPPANNPEPLAVGATTSSGVQASFSSTGPGACAGRTQFPDLVAPGDATCSTNLSDGFSCGFGGTSFSSPIAAGCAALVKSANPALTPDEIFTILKDTAMDIPNNDCGTPQGDPNYRYGEGIVDCYAAVQAAGGAPADIPWVWEDPISGTIPPYDFWPIDVTFICTETGELTGTLQVRHNDPCQEAIDIPLGIHCVEACEPVDILTVSTAISECVVAFDAIWTGDPINITYLWDFGDGMTDTVPMPIHDYVLPGTYTGSLEMTNCFTPAVDVEPFVVTVDCYICEPVTGPWFNWTPATPAISQVVTFNGYVASGSNVTYDWDFGDGNTGTGQTVMNTYYVTGTYTVMMTASNECSLEVVTDTVTVVAEPVCEPVIILNVTEAISECVVDFAAELSGWEPYTYTWDFGTFGTSNSPTPQVTFISGTHPYTLTVDNPCGTDTYMDTVTVQCEPPEIVYFIYLPLVPKTYIP